MEYHQIYRIKQLMHLRPFTNLINTILDLEDKYSEMEIILHNATVDLDVKNSQIKNPKSIMSLLGDAIEEKFKKGSSIKVTVLGDYPKEVLKESADKVGNIFSEKE